uniref:Uncharacterized protein n=1 Tax=Oryza brachyantha TaxID=4533 RepID=J3LTD2_ORYBR
MGFVLVISLPLIFFSVLLGFGCYFLGKHKGREEMRTGVGAQSCDQLRLRVVYLNPYQI